METQAKIEINVESLDVALEKANRLLLLLREVEQILCSLSKSTN